MKTYGLALCLRDDGAAIERYKEYHREVWPEVLARIREVGITQMEIFLLGRRLFMHITAEDDFEPARDFPRLNEDPKSQEWDALMRALQERAPEAAADQWWAPMEQVFDSEWPQHRSAAAYPQRKR
ncbi:MAG: L-rhamnose mutarotase [Chloroflexi bacterium]|nr:L-rhamnose mutarotase [Chloroflexota bacterium]